MNTEEDIKLKFITPAVENAGWDKMSQVKMEYSFTDGRINVRGNIITKSKSKRADYILSYRQNFPIAIIEAKDDRHNLGAGMQQALEYAKMLDIPFVYSSNGNGFLEHDSFTGKEIELSLENFPSPDELYERYKKGKQITEDQEKIMEQPYYYNFSDKKEPRYYQRIAINRTIEAISKGQNRILIVMATGTGKTFTAFQIVYRLLKAKTKRKILYLADRNILIDQTKSEDFKPLEKVTTKVESKKLDSSYQVYFALYQQLYNPNDNEPLKILKQLSPDFFDLIIVDECHRGSAKDDSNWREILNYFKSATQIGMTATPKETKDASNIYYFGKPIYTYSLKQGIEDGFLAPYKVVSIRTNIDDSWRPPKGKTDIDGELIEDREYNLKDYDRTIIIDERTKIVAKRITEFLKNTNRFDKTIVFCVDIDHAEAMRQALINENSDLVKENNNYIVRITGDTKDAKKYLDNFIAVDEKYPTIATTSKLMTTGVNSKTCKLIVLDSFIGSMTEFKQIIGRGTRIKEEYGKQFFTIMDFRGNTRQFADPKFDGEPVSIIEVKPDETIKENEQQANNEQAAETINDKNKISNNDHSLENKNISNKRTKIRVNGIDVFVSIERVQYYDKDGKLITESFTDFSKRNILNKYATLDTFLKNWNNNDKKEAIIQELKDNGVLLDKLRKETNNYDLDDFDLICHIAYDKKPLTKAERVNNVKKRDYLHKYSELAQKVINQLLEHYMNEGIEDLFSIKILALPEFQKIASQTKIIKEFNGKIGFLNAVNELQNQLYL